MTVCPLCNREVDSGEPTSEKSEPVAEKKPVKRAPRKKAT
jgi:hypothetical protein